MVMNDAYTIRYISFFLNTSCPKPVVGRDLFFCSFKQLKQDPFPPLVCSAKHTTTTQHMPFFNTSSLIFILEHYKNSWPAPLFFSSFLKMITKLQFAPPLASSSFPTSPPPPCTSMFKWIENGTNDLLVCPVPRGFVLFLYVTTLFLTTNMQTHTPDHCKTVCVTFWKKHHSWLFKGLCT